MKNNIGRGNQLSKLKDITFGARNYNFKQEPVNRTSKKANAANFSTDKFFNTMNFPGERESQSPATISTLTDQNTIFKMSLRTEQFEDANQSQNLPQINSESKMTGVGVVESPRYAHSTITTQDQPAALNICEDPILTIERIIKSCLQNPDQIYNHIPGYEKFILRKDCNYE